MKDLKFRTPVKCQNGHKAFWYWKHSGRHFLQIETIQKPPDNTCGCSKFAIGEGWERDGDDQMFSGIIDKKDQDAYDGDIIKYSNTLGETGIAVIKQIFNSQNLGLHWIEQNTENPSLFDACFYFGCREELEIIGSTHLNPELIP